MPARLVTLDFITFPEGDTVCVGRAYYENGETTEHDGLRARSLFHRTPVAGNEHVPAGRN